MGNAIARCDFRASARRDTAAGPQRKQRSANVIKTRGELNVRARARACVSLYGVAKIQRPRGSGTRRINNWPRSVGTGARPLCLKVKRDCSPVIRSIFFPAAGRENTRENVWRRASRHPSRPLTRCVISLSSSTLDLPRALLPRKISLPPALFRGEFREILSERLQLARSPLSSLVFSTKLLAHRCCAFKLLN